MTAAHDKTDAAASALSSDDAGSVTPTDAGGSRDVIIIVARTGGIAGLRREWRAEPPATAEPKWATLIENCPWEDEVDAGDGADRYTWHIQARCGPAQHEAELPEQAVQGPWRELVDVVRALHPATPAPTPGAPPRPSRR